MKHWKRDLRGTTQVFAVGEKILERKSFSMALLPWLQHSYASSWGVLGETYS